jgi:ferredoxin-NADP reductase
MRFPISEGLTMTATTAHNAAAEPAVDGVIPGTESFTRLRVKHVIRETRDAISLVFDVPDSHTERFRYRAGQYLTLQVQIDDREHRRCYSISSSPAVEEDLRVTVKRDGDGLVSNWLNDTAAAGTELRVAPPQGRFVLRDSGRGLVAFAGGSGITPVFSLIRTALLTSPRHIRLFYANRELASVLFDEHLAALVEEHSDRMALHHHLDELSGVVQCDDIATFIAGARDDDYYVCGPTAFMDTVQSALLDAGAPADRVHFERFTAAEPSAATEAQASITADVTVDLGGRSTTVAYRAGSTLLQTARSAGLRAPSSCETGSCGTCMARVVDGSARMLNNDALSEDEVADGWILTCQSLPTSPTIRIVYE